MPLLLAVVVVPMKYFRDLVILLFLVAVQRNGRAADISPSGQARQSRQLDPDSIAIGRGIHSHQLLRNDIIVIVDGLPHPAITIQLSAAQRIQPPSVSPGGISKSARAD